MLGDGGEDVNGQPVGFGHVYRHEFYAAFHQPADEMHVARQPVELGDDQHRLIFPAGIERGGELRAVVLPAALNLGKALNNKFPVSVQEDIDGLLLGFKPQPAAALARVDTRK